MLFLKPQPVSPPWLLDLYAHKQVNFVESLVLILADVSTTTYAWGALLKPLCASISKGSPQRQLLCETGWRWAAGICCLPARNGTTVLNRCGAIYCN